MAVEGWAMVMDQDRDLEALEGVNCEVRELIALYPSYFRVDEDLCETERIRMAAEALVRRGIRSAVSHDWVAQNLDDAACRVLVKEFLVSRLVEILEERFGIDRTCKRLAHQYHCDLTEAFDIVEDAIAMLVRRGHAHNDQETLVGFWYMTLREAARDHLESRKRHREALEAHCRESVPKKEPADSALTQLIGFEQRSTLLSAVRNAPLSSEAKAAILLKYFEEWTSTRIGEVIGKSADQVNRLTYQARALLQVALRSIDSTALVRDTTVDTQTNGWQPPPDASHQELAAVILSLRYQLCQSEVARACRFTEKELSRLVAVSRETRLLDLRSP